MADTDKPVSAFAQAASQAAVLATQGARGREQAARLLLAHCGARLVRYMQSHGRASEGEAQELVTEALLSFLNQPCSDPRAAGAWLMRVARNGLIDWARKRSAKKRGEGTIEISLDDDDFITLIDTHHGHTELPAWVRDCVQRAAAVMQRENPERFTVLLMVYEDWPAEDIATYFGATAGAVTNKQKTAARDRKYNARREAQTFFQHCRD